MGHKWVLGPFKGLMVPITTVTNNEPSPILSMFKPALIMEQKRKRKRVQGLSLKLLD